MDNIIITKRIEPYNLLEGIKKDFSVEDFTFTGMTKPDVFNKFLDKLEKLKQNQQTFGFYMKNVNKFYLAHLSNENFDITKNIKIYILEKIFLLTSDEIDKKVGFTNTESVKNTVYAVDMGKAEAGIIF